MTGLDMGNEIAAAIGRIERSNPALSESARVKAAWNRVADSRVRPHVTAVYVVPGTSAREVIVYTDSPIWASELGMQSELMRLKLNVELASAAERRGEEPSADGEGQVRKLRFVASKDRYLAKERRESTYDQLAADDRQLGSVEPRPLSPRELTGLETAAAGIEDETLRRAALLAAKASLEWRHGLEDAGLEGREESGGHPDSA